MRPKAQTQAIGISGMATSEMKLQIRPGVFERMRAVRPEEAAAVGAELFDRQKGGDRAAGNGLGGAFQRGGHGGAVEGHRHANPRVDQRPERGEREQEQDQNAGDIALEVAEIAAA